MAIPHVFVIVEGTIGEPDCLTIVLRDGAKIRLPLIARPKFNLIRPCDRILIDFEQWNTERELAHICVLRDGLPVTHFGVGKDGCIFEGLFF